MAHVRQKPALRPGGLARRGQRRLQLLVLLFQLLRDVLEPPLIGFARSDVANNRDPFVPVERQQPHLVGLLAQPVLNRELHHLHRAGLAYFFLRASDVFQDAQRQHVLQIPARELFRAQKRIAALPGLGIQHRAVPVQAQK